MADELKPWAVKPLEWEQPDGPEGTSWLAHGTDWCQFYIRFDVDTASYWMPGETSCEDAEEYLALDEAKAAAQADYETRIRSALYLHPSPSMGKDVDGLADLVRRLTQGCTDYDGSLVPDGAEPISTTTCGDLREAAAALSGAESSVESEIEGLVTELEVEVAQMAIELQVTRQQRDEALGKTYKKAAEEISLDIEAGYAASVRQVEALQDEARALRAELEQARKALEAANALLDDLAREIGDWECDGPDGQTIVADWIAARRIAALAQEKTND
jgi:hypothetical protein